MRPCTLTTAQKKCLACPLELGAFGLHAAPDKKLAGGGWLASTSRLVDARSSMPARRSSRHQRAGLLAGWLGGWVAGTDEPASTSRLVDAGSSTCPTRQLVDMPAHIADIDGLAGSRVCITKTRSGHNCVKRHTLGLGSQVWVGRMWARARGLGASASFFLRVLNSSCASPFYRHMNPARRAGRDQSARAQVPSCKSGEEYDSPSRNENGGVGGLEQGLLTTTSPTGWLAPLLLQAGKL